MADDLWNAQLTRENFKDFYMSTVVMVYPSVYKITKEATRCENAIVKSYLDVYSKRAAIPGDKVIYVFGDILLENAKHIVEEYPLPADMTYSDRLLDEYTRNSMLEKITAKIDSRTFKMAEFISTDVKKTGMTMVTRKKNDIFAVTPLLVLEIKRRVVAAEVQVRGDAAQLDRAEHIVKVVAVYVDIIIVVVDERRVPVVLSAVHDEGYAEITVEQELERLRVAERGRLALNERPVRRVGVYAARFRLLT